MSSDTNAQPTLCQHCGHVHSGTCPRIKSVEYEGGQVKKITYHDPETPIGSDHPPEDSLLL